MKKLLSIILATILCLSLFTVFGCKQETNDPKTYDVGTMNGNVVLMNGFEYFDRDVQLVRMFNEFGKIDQNSDMKYVHSGEKSLKLTPLGSRVHTANPFIVLPASSNRFKEVAFADFTKVEKVSLWFYNAEETPLNVGIGFGKGIIRMNSESRRDEIYKTNVEYFTLKSGWNFIDYTVQHALLAMQGLKITEVYGIVLEFDYVESHNLSDSPEVYIDDVYLTYADKAFTTEFKTEVKTGTTDSGNVFWSICDFENPIEQYYLYYNYTFPAPASAHPVIKTVFAGDYGVVTKTGVNALLIQKKHGGTVYGWPSMILPSAPIKAVFDAIGNDLVENTYNYELKFDIYNGANVANGFSLEFYEGFIPTSGATDMLAFWQSVSVPKNEWKTYSFNLGTINNKALAVLEAYPDSGIKTFLENPQIRMQWSRYNNESDLSDRPFFIDNVRIEKIA